MKMKLKLFILFVIFGLSNNGFTQNLNMIIEVNDRLITSEIAGIYLSFKYTDGTKIHSQINYHPGELILNENLWNKIKSDSLNEITLKFNYYTYKRGNQDIANFEFKMSKFLFERQYLILRVYDFRERKYRKKYGCLTDEDYIYEFNFPQGGILISCG